MLPCFYYKLTVNRVSEQVASQLEETHFKCAHDYDKVINRDKKEQPHGGHLYFENEHEWSIFKRSSDDDDD